MRVKEALAVLLVAACAIPAGAYNTVAGVWHGAVRVRVLERGRARARQFALRCRRPLVAKEGCTRMRKRASTRRDPVFVCAPLCPHPCAPQGFWCASRFTPHARSAVSAVRRAVSAVPPCDMGRFEPKSPHGSPCPASAGASSLQAFPELKDIAPQGGAGEGVTLRYPAM